MKSLYVVDGSGYIFRAFYAVAPLSNSKGLPTNALLGFSRMLVKLIKDVKAEYLLVTFDTGEPTFRHKAFDAYKANRSECPEKLVEQMPYFRKIVQAFGMPCYEQVGFEADDIIATVTKQMVHAGHEVTIVSGDKDLTQLVSPQVTVWDAMRDIRYTEDAVREKFGVSPHQIVDFLALQGDSSDNVPGVKGIGEKTAQMLIQHFGSVDALLRGIPEIENIDGLRGKATVRKKIEEGIESLQVSKDLVTLCDTVTPYNAINDIETFRWSAADPELLVPLFEELEFTKMLPSIPFVDSTEVVRLREARVAENQPKYQILDEQSLATVATALAKEKAFAIDTETTSLDPLLCDLVGISLSWTNREAYYLPITVDTGATEGVTLENARKYLNPILADEQIEKRGSNLKYDLSVLTEKGFTLRGPLFDTMLASYVLHPDGRQHGLKSLTRQYLQESMASYDELMAGHGAITEVPIDRVAKYACHDADATWRLSQVLEAELGEPVGNQFPSRRYVFDSIEMPLVPVLSKIERNGIRVDLGILESLSEEFKQDLYCLERSIYQHAGSEFNINSTKQLATVLFEQLALPTAGLKKTKSGISTDASVLSKLSGQHPIIDELLEYRELFKLNSTYVESLKRLIHPKTGRIHTSFNQAVAATGRLSSSDPNLQNIPIRNPRGRRVRAAFVAEPGCKFIAADYSQIELRVLAHLSGDASLLRAFQEGEDIHSRTAKELFGELSSPDEQSQQRRIAKTINFGIIYGMSAFRLSNDLGISRKQAQRYIDDYFARYPKVREYFDRLERDIDQNGYVETLFGRRRFLADINADGRDAGYLKRSLLNAPLQGSAAEIIKLAMIELHRQIEPFGDRVRLVLQVHDELVLEVMEADVEEVAILMEQAMENAVSLSVPLKVDLEISSAWH